MTNLIDLTRQGSIEMLDLGKIMDRYVSNCLQSKFSQDLVNTDAFSLLPLSHHATENTATEPADLLRRFNDEFRELSTAKMKVLIEENPTFLTVLLQTINHFSFQTILSGENTSTQRLDEYGIGVECFLSVFLAFEDYLFMIIDQNPKELFQDFLSILSLILSTQHTTQNSLSATFAKLVVSLFRILTLLLLVLNRSLKASLSQGRESPDHNNLQTSIESFERDRTIIELLGKLKEDYNDIIPKALSFLANRSDSYGRGMALSLQKYLFELTDAITADLCQLLLEILTHPTSLTLPSAITVMEKMKNLSSLTDYYKLLTTICFYDQIYLFPQIVQNVLKCHAAISSFILLALPSHASSKGSLLSTQTKSGSGNSISAVPTMKGSHQKPMNTASPIKNSIQHYFSDMKSDDLADLSIRKRKFGDARTSSENSQQERRQQILQLFQHLVPKFMEYLDIGNDIISQFLFTLYLHLYPAKHSSNAVVWNYHYSNKSTSQLITILVPFLYVTHHLTLPFIARLLLSVIIRLQGLGEGEERPQYPQYPTFTVFQQQQSLGKDIPSLMTIFANKKGISYSQYFLTGVSMIVKDEQGNSVAMAFQQIIMSSPMNNDPSAATTAKSDDLKSLFYQLLPEILEIILKLYLAFYSTSIIGSSNISEKDSEREQYASLMTDTMNYLVEIHQGNSSKAFLSNLQLIPTANERLFLQCLQKREVGDLAPFILLFATPTSSLRQEVQHKKDQGITDIFSHLEEREEQRQETQNKRQKISAMLDGEQQWKKKKDAEEEADSLWKWMDANRLPQKPSSVSNNNSRAIVNSGAASSTLLRKAGVVDTDWKRQIDSLKREKELARQKVKASGATSSGASTVMSTTTLKRQGSSSFMTMHDDANHDPKKGNEGDLEEEEEESVALRKPVVIFDIHKYMKDQKDSNPDKSSIDPVISEQERSLLETKRLLEAINRREHFFQFRDSTGSGLDPGNIGDSILSVSIDSICKDILNLPLASLVTESLEEDRNNYRNYHNNNIASKEPELEEGEEEIEEGEVIITKKKSLQRGDSITTVSTKKELQPLPLRFSTAEQYVNAFQPLLVEEFIAALTAQILNEDQQNINQLYHHRYSANDGSKEFQEIYVQSEVIATKSSDPGLMEIQIRLDDNHYFGNNNNNRNKNNNSKGNNNSPHIDLQKDELVLVFKGHHAIPSAVRQRKELAKVKHIIGIITHTAPRKRAETSSNHTPMNQGPSHTILVRRTTEIHPKQPLLVIPIMNLSTFLREWTALHSIHNPTLVPLAPYLMSGSPVCSPAVINSLSERIQSKIRAIENMKRLLGPTATTSSSTSSNAATDEPMATNPISEDLQKLESSLYQEIAELDQLNVDPSILKATGIAKLLVTVVKRVRKTTTDSTTPGTTEEIKIPSYVTLAEALIERWRQLVREQSNAETIKNLKGGKVIKIPPKEEITIPRGITPTLWTVLAQRYNESQLYAIQYVVSQFDSKQDTRIGLIQGPPGSGKTSTIIGIVSALLNYSGFVTKTMNTSNTMKEDSNAAKQHLMPYSVAPVSSLAALHQQRILICAPSNAAIDEILTRLTLSGIYNQEGQLVPHALKIVRLGEASGGSNGGHQSSPLIHSLTLDYQIEQRLVKEDLYQKYLTLQDHLQQLESQYQEKLQQARFTSYHTNPQQPSPLDTQLATLRRQLYEYRNNKLLYEISLDRLRGQFRQQLLLEANIVGTTLSSAGKQQFLDYIMKENVFFTTCIIDEAGQTTEPSTLIPLRFGCRRLVLVGDPRQLPATVLSRKAERYGLGRSLFERLEKAEHEVVMLTMQYRMHPEIRSFPSKYFYQNLLIDSPEIQEEVSLVSSIHNSSLLPTNYMNYRVISPRLLQAKIPPVVFMNITQAKETKQGKSFINELEITYLLQFLVFLTQQQIIRPSTTNTSGNEGSNDEAAMMTVGIISPYKAQVRLIQQRCLQHPLLQAFFPQSPQSGRHSRGEPVPAESHHSVPVIEINTVDGFQGREKDIVLISTVRANSSAQPSSTNSSSSIGRIGFVADERRLNVAITRGRKSLVIFGNRDTLYIDPVWREMIQSLSERKYLYTPDQLPEIFHN